VLEIAAKDFRELAFATPALLDHISTVISTRRTGLEGAKAAAVAAAAPEARQNFLARMRRFLTLHS
jgi:CRP-like cAMP-binding protein